jgi:hypothetical protein
MKFVPSCTACLWFLYYWVERSCWTLGNDDHNHFHFIFSIDEICVLEPINVLGQIVMGRLEGKMERLRCTSYRSIISPWYNYLLYCLKCFSVVKLKIVCFLQLVPSLSTGGMKPNRVIRMFLKQLKDLLCGPTSLTEKTVEISGWSQVLSLWCEFSKMTDFLDSF